MLITNWLPHIIIFDSRGAPLARFESANLIALNRQVLRVVEASLYTPPPQPGNW